MEFVNGKDDIPWLSHIWNGKFKTCFKPPTVVRVVSMMVPAAKAKRPGILGAASILCAARRSSQQKRALGRHTPPRSRHRVPEGRQGGCGSKTLTARKKSRNHCGRLWHTWAGQVLKNPFQWVAGSLFESFCCNSKISKSFFEVDQWPLEFGKVKRGGWHRSCHVITLLRHPKYLTHDPVKHSHILSRQWQQKERCNW